MQSSVTDLLQNPIVALNVGLKKFSQSLQEQQVDVQQVDWVPPAGGEQDMIDLLDQLL